MSGQQQQQSGTIYTIHESQLNNGGQRNNSQSDILIDTSSIPMTQQTHMPPMSHQHLQPSATSTTQFDATGGGGAITSQPAVVAGGSASARVAPESQNVVYSVHPAFAVMESLDTLLVRQKADCTSTCCGFESANTYTVRASDGSSVLRAVENSNCCERCCFEGNREFDLSLVHGDEVVAKVTKPYRLARFCCYSNAVRVESPADNPIGHIRQLFSFFGHPRFAVFDSQQPPKTPTFLVESVSCRFCLSALLCTSVCANREFRVTSVETREQVATIARRLSSERRRSGGDRGDEPDRSNTDDDDDDNNNNNNHSGNKEEDDERVRSSRDAGDFGIQFECSLESRHKVLLLSACFLMDFFYFEGDRRRRKLASC